MKVGLLLYLISFTTVASYGAEPVRKLQYELIKVSDHFTDSYTQGLFFDGEYLYESNGQYGSSSFLKMDKNTGKVLQRVDYDSDYFIEGSCVFGNYLYVLTWMEHVCFVYDKSTMTEIARFINPKQGWGLTTDGTSLIMSDGSSSLYFLDPASFMEKKTLSVTYKGKPLNYLNELEYINGRIWANVYLQDIIVIIDPETGVVESELNMSALKSYVTSSGADVLNGIAHDPATGKILLTGKLWGKMFEIKLK